MRHLAAAGRTGTRTGRLLVGALALALALGGCGGDPPEPQPVGEARAGGSVATLADCSDWREGTVEERRATIEHVRSEITPDGAAAESSALPDDRAYEFFERACAPPYASSFRLYKIYTRAATFGTLEP